MSGKTIGMATVMLCLAGAVLAFHPKDAHAGCVEDCYTNCCGDEGICNGDDEMSCVTDCLKNCDTDSGPAYLSTPDDDKRKTDRDDRGDEDDVEQAPGKSHRPVGGAAEPRQKEPNPKKPEEIVPQGH